MTTTHAFIWTTVQVRNKQAEYFFILNLSTSKQPKDAKIPLFNS